MAVRRMLVAGRYRLHEPVGTGGMGRVWLARDEMLDRDVAIKELVPPDWMTYDERDKLRVRTLREARSAARLNHPNVVQIHDVIHAEGLPWIVMEYVPSRSLDQIMRTDGPLEPPAVALIGLRVLDALTAAHQAGVLHRDVKPHNVLIGDDARVVLTDFGLATFMDDGGMTQPGLIVGSPHYVSPERARDGSSTAESDLWSLGATLYAAVEGRPPYARETAMATLLALATEPPDPPRRAGPLTGLLLGLLRHDPGQRLTPDAVAAHLRRARDSGVPVLPVPNRSRMRAAAAAADLDRAGRGVGRAMVPPPRRGNTERSGAPVPAAPAAVERPALAAPPAGLPVPRQPAPVVPGRAAPTVPPRTSAGPASGVDGSADVAVQPARTVAVPAPAVPTVPGPRRPDRRAVRTRRVIGGAIAAGLLAAATGVVAQRQVGDDARRPPGTTAPTRRASGQPTPGSSSEVDGPAGTRDPGGVSPSALDGATGHPRGGTPAAGDGISGPGGSAPAPRGAAATTGARGEPDARARPPRGPDGNPAKTEAITAVAGFGPQVCATAPAAGRWRTPRPGAQRLTPDGRLLPRGWSYHRDRSGFGVAVPDGWTIRRFGTTVCFADPGGTRLLSVDLARSPAADPVDACRREADRLAAARALAGYAELGIGPVRYFDKAADWEYRYRGAGGGGLHARTRWFAGGERAFALGWLTTAADWRAERAGLALVLASFQPVPT